MTPQQAKLLHYIRLYQRRCRGVSPSFEEMARALKIAKSGVHRHLHKLTERGYVAKRTLARRREIDIVKLPPHERRIPREARV